MKTRAQIFSDHMKSEQRRLEKRDVDRKQADAWIRAVSLWGAMAAAREAGRAAREASTDERKRALAWFQGNDTGTSSETIWFVMVGLAMKRGDTPSDRDDFGRCHRLILKMPEWRARLPELAAAHPRWAGIVEHWDELVRMYQRSPRHWHEMSDRLRALTRDA